MKDKIKEIIPYIIIIICVALFRSFIATPIRINGTSMYDTLKGNEICILNKLAKIDRYDIVVAYYKNEDANESEKLIKRVIAMPGETIYAKDGFLFINGKKIKDKYATNETSDFDAVTLAKDEYFLMGDNRYISKDSRIIGPINKKDIKGTTNFILYPFTKIGTIDK